MQLRPVFTSFALALALAAAPLAGAASPGPAGSPAGAASGGAPQVSSPAPLLGAWISNGDDGERLEFRAGGVALVAGTEGRFTVRGERLELVLGGQRVRATFRVEGDVLHLAVEAERGAHKASYRRAEAPLALAAGPARLALPAGWAVVRREGETVVIDPLGDRSGAAWVLVAAEPSATSGAEALQQKKRPVTAELRAALAGLSADLASEGVTLTRPRSEAEVQALAVPAPLAAAEVQLAGRAADQRAVTVWVGLARGAEGTVTVLLVAEAARGAALVEALRRSLTGVTFAKPAATSEGGLPGLEFGHSSFGSDASLTTVYRFGANGRLIRRTMFSSPLGGSDSEATGTYTVHGQRVIVEVESERIEATLVREGTRVTAIRIGRVSYSRL